MPPLRPCVERIKRNDGTWGPCGELSSGARCIEHRRAYAKKRLEKEPWRHLYDHPLWTKSKVEVLARDEHRCTFSVGSRRCNNVDLLEVHHEEKLRHTWERCGKPQRGQQGWDRFLREATDPRKLRALCQAHHKHVDNTDPREAKRHPGELARASVKRQMRSGKRRALLSTKGRKTTRPTRRQLRESGEDAC